MLITYSDLKTKQGENDLENSDTVVVGSNTQSSTLQDEQLFITEYMSYVKENLYNYVTRKANKSVFKDNTNKLSSMLDKNKLTIPVKTALKRELDEITVAANFVEDSLIILADDYSYDLYAKHILPIYSNEINKEISNDGIKDMKLSQYVIELDSFSANPRSSIYEQKLKSISNRLFAYATSCLDESFDDLKNRCNSYFDTDISREVPFWKTLKHTLVTKVSKNKRNYYNSKRQRINDSYLMCTVTRNRLHTLYKCIGINLMKYSDYDERYYEASVEGCRLIKDFIDSKSFSQTTTKHK